MSSKSIDRVLDAIDVGFQTPAPAHNGARQPDAPGKGKCWRCLHHPSRVPGEDFTCEACFAYLTAETDEDPRAPRRYTSSGQGFPLPDWWGGGQHDETHDPEGVIFTGANQAPYGPYLPD